ncbi:hypothetical protein BDV59DRAFT_43535 [Aspergillus ambiguus]|uniref:uncharacterized protein n=1 Tax=Aspergillus ambiguus TaxID=176160 RepID=UPI003CCDF957
MKRTLGSSDQRLQPHEARRQDRPRQENTKLSTAQFWADKANALDDPVEVSSDACAVSALLTASVAASGGVRNAPTDPLTYADTPSMLMQNPQTILPKATAIATGPPPLSNEAIADILRKTKPECPRAQAWVQAHEIQKAAQERKDRAELRKTVVRRLRDKAREAAKKSGASKREIREFLGELPQEESAGATMAGDPKDDTLERIHERVRLAHERLQQTIADYQGRQKRG